MASFGSFNPDVDEMDNDGDEEYPMDNYDDEPEALGSDWDKPRARGPRSSNDAFRNQRYREAYGNYSGGYQQSGFRQGPSFISYDMPPQPFCMGRGYGPFGPPVIRPKVNNYERAMKFLARCGIEWEEVKKLPGPLLAMIHTDGCGLCTVDFDSFNFARMHYASKNHLKNQKKWLTQRFGDGPTKREMPFKARDLYCELCDVHITSKVHAESHYAGKPHRSIVERRRAPKNPFLLKSGMEQRVEQLIRREKRCLKPAESKPIVDEPEVFMDPKPVPPELYCEICKTSVTNSEQMTTHLNGKKHLQKEKNHIFQFMKGGPNKIESEEEATIQTVEALADEVLEAEKCTNEGRTDQEIDESTEEWQNGGGEKW